MIVLRAESFHCELLSLRGEMRLVSLFPHAWHLRTSAGWIITVTTARYNGPLAICLAQRSLSGLPVRPGIIARWDSRTLTVGSVELDLSESARWEPPEQGNTLDAGMLLHDLRTVIDRSREAGRGGISAHLLSDATPHAPDGMQQRALAAVSALKTATTKRDLRGLNHGIHALVGLGPGLTPSGDDLLCGFVAGLAVLGARIEGTRPMAPQMVVNAIVDASVRTTSLGRTLLTCATGGAPLSGRSGSPVAIEPLLSVLWSLGTLGGLRDLDKLLRIGHSSGSDMLAGALVAAETVLEGGCVGDPALVGSA